MMKATRCRINYRKSTEAAVMLAGAVAGLLLQGCGLTASKDVGTSPIPIVASRGQGSVMGGQQPVAGVALQLYVVGTTYGGAASKLGPSFATLPTGNFTLPAYTCPTPSSLVFLVGTGGTPIGGSLNNNLALMAGLGACSGVGSTFIAVNEVTTVATVYALSGFMSGPTSIGAPASNALGIGNAFAAINKVVNIASGAASGPALPSGANLPVTEINALGNILQNCVNSAGGTASDTTDGLTNGTPCGKLFYLTKGAGAAATDTITATMLLAQNPGLPAASVPSYVAKLNDLQASSPAFTPALSVNSPPTDWTIAITYTGGGLASPRSVATDANGNVWVTNPGNNSVTELNNTGAALSPAGGFTVGALSTPYGIAIDQSGFVWVANSGNSTISRLNSTGTSGTAFSGGGLNAPKGLAIDGAGNVWAANSGANTTSAFTNAGAPIGGTPFSAGGIMTPTSIAINPK